MSKFAGSTNKPHTTNVHGFIETTPEVTATFEGGSAFARTVQSDLFLLAVTNMVSEDTFYESAATRDKRFVDLVHEVTKITPEFILGEDPENGKVGLARYLRQTMLMRSAAVVLACEYVAAGGPNGRLVVDAVCQRPDEPAEVIGYWTATYGRKLPYAIKRGVADAARRLFNEKAAIKYDGQSRGIRLADVIELVHPKPKDAKQSSLFKHLLDKRHHDSGGVEDLPILAKARELDRLSGDQLLESVRNSGPGVLAEAGYTWERLSGKTAMSAEAWEAVIPSMGAMALIRNLRNFEQAGISEQAVDAVIAKITDPDEVEKSRIFPYQAWSAYRFSNSDNWKRALGKTLDLTTQNIPDGLDGTLVVIDTSGSMQATVSGRSKLTRTEVAAVMGAATYLGTKNSDIVIYGQSWAWATPPAGVGALQIVEKIMVSNGAVGHATYGHTAIAATFNPAKHKRVVLFTDDQQADSGHVNLDHVPLIYVCNLAGYNRSSLETGQHGRFAFGGFSDAGFKAIPLLESSRNADWPF